MPKRHTRLLPKLWLMTDERLGDRLLPSMAALPRGSGIIFRHYSLCPQQRRALFERIRHSARRHGHNLIIAGDVPHKKAVGAHGKKPKHPHFLHTVAVHSVREGVAAQRRGADLLFVSPLFATRSHPAAKPLGRVRFGLMIRHFTSPVIALGGMTQQKARSLTKMGIYGWAAIDGLTH